MALHKLTGAWITPTRDGGVVIRIPGLLGNNTVVLLPNRYKDTEKHPDYNVLVEILTEEERRDREEYREKGEAVKNAVVPPVATPGRAGRPIGGDGRGVGADTVKVEVKSDKDSNGYRPRAQGSDRVPELPDSYHYHALGLSPNGTPQWEAVHHDDIRIGDVLRIAVKGFFTQKVTNPVTNNNLPCFRVIGVARGKTVAGVGDEFETASPSSGSEELQDPFAE